MRVRYISSFAVSALLLLAPSKQASAGNPDPAVVYCQSYNNTGDYGGTLCGGNEVAYATCTTDPAVGGGGEETCQVYVPANPKTHKAAIPADSVGAEYTNLQTEATLEISLAKNSSVGNWFAYNQMDCSDGSLQIADYCSNYPNGRGEGGVGKQYNWCWIQNNTIAYVYSTCPSGYYSEDTYFELWATNSTEDPEDNF